MTDVNVQPTEDFGECSCGKPAQRYWRGSPTCWSCWHWFKLGINEAKFWYRGIEMLHENELGSGPDINDLRQWEAWGVQEEVLAALQTLNDLQDRYATEAELHGLNLHEWMRNDDAMRKRLAETEVR